MFLPPEFALFLLDADYTQLELRRDASLSRRELGDRRFEL